jgi:hypothetical protein
MSFSRNPELGDLPARDSGVLGNFPLLVTYAHSTGEVRGPYLSGMIVGYLHIIYRHGQSARYSWLLVGGRELGFGLFQIEQFSSTR